MTRNRIRHTAFAAATALATSTVIGGCADPVTIPELPSDARVAFVDATFRGGTSATDLGDAFYVSFGAWETGPGGLGESDANVFEAVPFAFDDVGRVVSIASDDDDPSFGLLTRLLSDADDNTVQVRVVTDGGSSSNSWLESRLMEPTRGAMPGPGFDGLHITKVSAAILNISVESPGSDPQGDGVWTDYTIHWRVDVFASVR